MPPETDAHTPPLADEALHPGCNCGKRKTKPAAAPLLTADLVIAARDRAREPELPAATAARALATRVSSKLARYDLVIITADLAHEERDARVAAEFARHEHRVFHFGPHQRTRSRPAAPTLRRITLADSDDAPPADLLRVLADLRRNEGIEAAVLFAPGALDAAVAHQIRDRWGWRIAAADVAAPDLGEMADVRVRFDLDHNEAQESDVALPATLSWPERWAALDRAFRTAWPRASVIVLMHDNLAFSRMCIASVLENTEYPNYELLLIDNASTDGTVEELQRLARETPVVRIILNEHNAGFGPGNNQGLSAAAGDVLVLLNNDTMVPRGWLTRLARHLEDERVGLIGPATNRTCNEAQIDVHYQTYSEFQAVARSQGQGHEGQRFPIRMPMMFCTAFRRDLYERIGPLDVRYEIGMFEDEDYALRAKAAGYQVVWTPEVYVHHAYHASIGKLLPTGEYARLVRLNQGRFEEKWGICWERHRPPPPPAA